MRARFAIVVLPASFRHMTRPLPALTLIVLATLLPTPALARRSMTVRVPKFEVPARSNREVCTFVPLPARQPMDVKEVRITNLGGKTSFGTHHLIVYAYTGDLTPLAGTEHRIVDDTACINFGGGDTTNLRIVATSQGIHSRQPMPRGTALRLTPGTMADGKQAIGLVLNSHWINGSDEMQRARAKVKFTFAKKRSVARELKPIFEVIANGTLKVSPGGTATVGYRWAPGDPGLSAFGSILGGTTPPDGPACVTMLIGHMHRRGTLFTADLVDRDGVRTNLYTNTQYADPPAVHFDPPLLVRVGEQIAYSCVHDNASDPRLGCEETAGATPGLSTIELFVRTGDFEAIDGTARLCHTPGPNPEECPPGPDPARPDRSFTGNCVPANLVFGFLSEDDMCILPGYFYDADPAAPPGEECVL
jgi:hypothetical protein